MPVRICVADFLFSTLTLASVCGENGEASLPWATVARLTMRKNIKKSSGAKPASSKATGSKKWKSARGGDMPVPKQKKAGKPSSFEPPKPKKKGRSNDKGGRHFEDASRMAESQPKEHPANEEPSFDSFGTRNRRGRQDEVRFGSGDAPDVGGERSLPRPTKKAKKPAKEENYDVPTGFDELGLADHVAYGVKALGFESPTPIQAQAIPVLLGGGDMIGQAQTGTGKTAAFALPVIQRIDPASNATQAIILAPTRELAVQVAGGIYDLSKHLGLKVVPVYGGQPIDRQFRALQNGAQIIVGTPGRVLDHLRRGSITFAEVQVAVLDEADEMLALGFAEDLDAILGELPESRQLVFFSATMPARILSLTKKFLRDPVHVKIEAKQRTVDTTNQTYYEVPNGKKLDALARVLDMETPGPTIVFCRTRQETSDLSENLRLRGYVTEALHGDMNQAERDRTMRKFRDGQADILVATDVAARGLDIDTVTHVINYDIPFDVEQYIHRIGRTGRAGRTGDAITLVTARERNKLRNIERLIGSPIRPAKIPTPADIAARRRDVFHESVKATLEKGGFESYLPMVADLADEFETVEIAAAALQMLWEQQHAAKGAPAPAMEDYEQPELGMERIFVGMGRQDGLRPGDLVGAITNEAGLTGNRIGVIDVLDRHSFVEVPAEHAERVLEVLRATKIRHRKVTVQMAKHATISGDR